MSAAFALVAFAGFLALMLFGADAASVGLKAHNVLGMLFGAGVLVASIFLLPGAL